MPSRHIRTNIRSISLLLAAVLIAGIGWLLFFREGSSHSSDNSPTKSSTHNSNQNSANSDQESTFDKTKYSLTDPTSQWVIVNKRRPLSPIDYTPVLTTPNIPLRLAAGNPEMHVSTLMAAALEKLVNAAKTNNVQLMLASGYRSYQTQASVYSNEVKRNGQVGADRVSARPGHSEHQTGLTVDLEPVSRQCEIQACFGELPEGKWLAAHAHEYGFIIRYPSGSEPITGYSYEPWHVRYVGEDLAQELHRLGNPILETFFGLEAAPDYN